MLRFINKLNVFFPCYFVPDLIQLPEYPFSVINFDLALYQCSIKSLYINLIIICCTINDADFL